MTSLKVTQRSDHWTVTNILWQWVYYFSKLNATFGPLENNDAITSMGHFRLSHEIPSKLVTRNTFYDVHAQCPASTEHWLSTIKRPIKREKGPRDLCFVNLAPLCQGSEPLLLILTVLRAYNNQKIPAIWRKMNNDETWPIF